MDTVYQESNLQLEMCMGLGIPMGWESHGNPMGIGQELNKTWEWEWESTRMGMGMTPIPMGIDSRHRLW